MQFPVRIELTINGMLIQFANLIHTDKEHSRMMLLLVEIYKAFCLDVAQGHMKGAPNKTRTHDVIVGELGLQTIISESDSYCVIPTYHFCQTL